MFRLMIILSGLLYASMALAQSGPLPPAEQILLKPPRSAAYQQCERQAADLIALHRCLDNEIKRQDQRLNRAYRAAMQRLQPFRRPALRDVQRLWIRYRDAKCGLYYHRESGSGGLLDMQECLLSETIRRAVELENLY